MRLRTFTADTMQAAMAQVRQDMGPDAIIVSSQKTRGGQIEVRAAVDKPVRPEPVARPIDTVLEAQSQRRATGTDRTSARGIRQIERALAFHRVPTPIVASLERAIGSQGGDEPKAALARVLEARFAFSPLSPSTSRPYMFVGLPGAGKTSALAKYAARVVLSDYPVELVNADGLRAGAYGQMSAYADLLKTTAAHAVSFDALAGAVHERDETKIMLIDAPATNVFDLDEVSVLRDLLRTANAEPVLVMDAGMDALTAGDAAELFQSLGARRMILTKFDAARRFGAALTAAHAGLSLAHFSATPFIGSGLTPATPLRLARLLLDDADIQDIASGMEGAA